MLCTLVAHFNLSTLNLSVDLQKQRGTMFAAGPIDSIRAAETKENYVCGSAV